MGLRCVCVRGRVSVCVCAWSGVYWLSSGGFVTAVTAGAVGGKR